MLSDKEYDKDALSDPRSSRRGQGVETNCGSVAAVAMAVAVLGEARRGSGAASCPSERQALLSSCGGKSYRLFLLR
jgi:hypothetical protein